MFFYSPKVLKISACTLVLFFSPLGKLAGRAIYFTFRNFFLFFFFCICFALLVSIVCVLFLWATLPEMILVKKYTINSNAHEQRPIDISSCIGGIHA